MTCVAIIFDDRVLYCRRALGELVRAEQFSEVEHFLPDKLETIPENRFDLHLFVNDGLIDSISDHLTPSAWSAMGIEVHICPGGSLDEYLKAMNMQQRGCVYHETQDWPLLDGLHCISF